MIGVIVVVVGAFAARVLMRGVSMVVVIFAGV